jgi:hypothetical protein
LTGNSNSGGADPTDRAHRQYEESLSGIESITNDADKTTGIVLRTQHGGALRLGVMADDLFVDGLVTPD